MTRYSSTLCKRTGAILMLGSLGMGCFAGQYSKDSKKHPVKHAQE